MNTTTDARAVGPPAAPRRASCTTDGVVERGVGNRPGQDTRWRRRASTEGSARSSNHARRERCWCRARRRDSARQRISPPADSCRPSTMTRSADEPPDAPRSSATLIGVVPSLNRRVICFLRPSSSLRTAAIRRAMAQTHQEMMRGHCAGALVTKDAAPARGNSHASTWSRADAPGHALRRTGGGRAHASVIGLAVPGLHRPAQSDAPERRNDSGVRPSGPPADV